ncbi:type II secretion system protein [uncultured Ilyobacter sp.]|uniref:type II secretion system protein n=1 Tax=uncultured Ilyobacter sp. TaxID=544433 RepID=UPI002AA844AC|nr:type II secretion system protein [uncultured Ilyobacter sp.]
MKRKGFTLIELVVVVAIILLLAATLAPKLRKEVAKARDAKAVAALGSLRTAVNIFYSDKGEAPTKLASETSPDSAIFDPSEDTSEYLEKNLITFLKDDGASDGEIAGAPVGGFRDSEGDTLNYGGFLVYDYDNTDDLEVTILGADTTARSATSTDGLYDTKDNPWSEY